MRNVFFLALMVLGACTASSHDPAVDPIEERARAVESEDAKRDGLDICDLFDFYGDGEYCDCFCDRADPDCDVDLPKLSDDASLVTSCGVAPTPSCPAPGEVEFHSCFTFDIWTCESGVQVVDPDGCGCYCEPAAEPDVCGGIAGLECDEGETCVDDPSDDCDPEAGGADCIGLCEPTVACPTPGEVEFHSCFTFDIWTCESGVEVVDPDGCGCYCVPAE